MGAKEKGQEGEEGGRQRVCKFMRIQGTDTHTQPHTHTQTGLAYAAFKYCLFIGITTYMFGV